MHLECNVSCKIPGAHAEIEEGCFQTGRERKRKLNDIVPHFNYKHIKMVLPMIQLSTNVSTDHLMIHSLDSSHSAIK
jgi:hypothetical protein